MTPFYIGQRVTCEIEGVPITDAKISIDKDGSVFICQNKKNGSDAENRLLYKYSWVIWRNGEIEGFAEGHNGVTNLKAVEGSVGVDKIEVGKKYRITKRNLNERGECMDCRCNDSTLLLWVPQMDGHLGEETFSQTVSSYGLIRVHGYNFCRHWLDEVVEEQALFDDSPNGISGFPKLKTLWEKPIKQSLTKKAMSIISNLGKSEVRKALEYLELCNECGELNERGIREWNLFTYETGTVDKEEFENRIVIAYKEAIKK